MPGPFFRGPEPVIRPMAEADLFRVLAIEAMSYAHPWKREQFLEELARHPFSRCLVAEAAGEGPAASGEVCAYILAWEVAGQVHISNLAVDPERRRQGVARLLLLRLLEDAKKDGATHCSLEVRVSNQAARTLYGGLGFVQEGVRKRYYPDGEDALVLSLEL